MRSLGELLGNGQPGVRILTTEQPAPQTPLTPPAENPASTSRPALTFNIKRDYPIIGAIILGAVRPVVLISLGKYNYAALGSDIAFSGLSFDLWAFTSLVVFNQELNGRIITHGERLVVPIFTIIHLVAYFALIAAPSITLTRELLFVENLALIAIVAAMLTYVPPTLFLHEKFRGPDG